MQTNKSTSSATSIDDKIAVENKAIYSHTSQAEQRRLALTRMKTIIKLNSRLLIPAAALVIFVGGGTVTAFVTRTPNIVTPYLSQAALDDAFSDDKDGISATREGVETNGSDPSKNSGNLDGDSSSSKPSPSSSSQPNTSGTSSSGGRSPASNRTNLRPSPRTGGIGPIPSTKPPVSSPRDPAYLSGWGMPVWRDEFSTASVDRSKWNVRERSDLGLLFDAAMPDRSQVSQSGSILHIRGDWLATPFSRPAGQSGIPVITHKTGYLDHRYLKPGNFAYSQRWGRWEMRAKTPTGPKTLGSLAAFWLRNSNSGEIDILESWGYNTSPAPGGQRINTSTTTVHTRTSGSGNVKYIWHHGDYQITKTVPWSGFHTYAFELMPTYAKIIVDGKTLVTTTPAKSPNLWNSQFFGTPLHVRLNLHVGPSTQYWGIPNINNKSATQALDYQVDYVRIYKP